MELKYLQIRTAVSTLRLEVYLVGPLAHDAALLHAAIVRAFRWPCGAYFLPGVVTFGEHPASKN